MTNRKSFDAGTKFWVIPSLWFLEYLFFLETLQKLLFLKLSKKSISLLSFRYWMKIPSSLRIGKTIINDFWFYFGQWYFCQNLVKIVILPTFSQRWIVFLWVSNKDFKEFFCISPFCVFMTLVKSIFYNRGYFYCYLDYSG